MTPRELLALLKLPVANSLYNTLHELVASGRLRRQKLAGLRLYLTAEANRAEAQIAHRQQQAAVQRPPPAQVSTETIIAVLVEVLHAGQVLVAAPEVAGRLRARAVDVTAAQVEQVFAHYGLRPEKKRRRQAQDPRTTQGADPVALRQVPAASAGYDLCSHLCR